MSYSGKIYWHDGLFLLPHHFQGMQREVLEGFSFQNKIHKQYHYGLIESSVDYALLENGYISFESLKAIMPSGIAIDIQNNAELAPYKVAFDKNIDHHMVYLGVPTLKAELPNTIINDGSSEAHKRLYKLVEEQVNNEDSGEDKNTLVFRKINARLLLDDDDMNGYDILPIMRIEKGINYSNHLKILVDEQYIPPALNINVSGCLKEIVHKTISNIIQNAKLAGKNLHAQHSFMENPEKLIKPLMRLKMLNEYGVELNCLINNPNTTPFTIYIALVKVIGGLATLIPEISPFETAYYDHDNLFECFSSIRKSITSCLQVSIDKKLYNEFKFMIEDKNTVSTKLTAQIIKESSNFYIGISTKMSINEVMRLVEEGDSLKVIAPSLNTGRAVPGIKLEYQHIISDFLPKRSGSYYFLIENQSNENVWQRIIEEEKIMVVGAEDILNKLELKLFTTIMGE